MTIPTISTLPTAPARTDAPATFISRADAFLAALVTMQGELNTSIGQMNTDIAGVNANADRAESAADSAVASANFKGAWSSLTGALNIPASVTHSGYLWLLLNNLADVTASEPGVSADWQKLPVIPSQTGNSGKFLTTDGSDTSWDYVDVSSEVTGTLSVANGGTGAATLTSNNVLLGNGTSPIQTVAPGTSGNILTSNGTTWVSATPGGGITYADASLSGLSSYTFSGIPSTAKQIFIGFHRIKSGGSDVRVRIGAGSIDSSSTYSGLSYRFNTSISYSTTSFTTYFALRGLNGEHDGTAVLTLVDDSNDTWGWSCLTGNSQNGTVEIQWSAGGKDLSGALDRVEISTSSGTFPTDAVVSLAYL